MQLLALIFLVFAAVTQAFAPRGAALGRRMMKFELDMKLIGKVKFFDVTKGFGFITPSEGGDDVFVHQSAVHAKGFRSLAEGEEVEYDISEDPKRGKKFAVNVTGPGGDFVKGAPRRDAGARDFGGGNGGF